MSVFDEAAIAANEATKAAEGATAWSPATEVPPTSLGEMEEQARKMQKAYDGALVVQSACNLSGVVFSFAEVMHTLCEEARRQGQGTEWRNTHPIVKLFVTQLLHLSFGDAVDAPQYLAAHDECCKNASKATLKMLGLDRHEAGEDGVAQ
jgi:hypothetical protein